MRYGMTEAMPVPPDVRSEIPGLMQSGYHLSQILEERARQLDIRGFKSFREAVVDESQRMPGPIALPVFAEQAGQGHRRPQLPELRNGYIRLSEFLPMFATKSLFKKSQELGMPVDDVDVDGIGDVLESHDRM